MTNGEQYGSTQGPQNAIEALNCIMVSPERYAFRQGIDRRWWVAPVAGLERWWALRDASGYAIEAPTAERYGAALMPAWWSPLRQFAHADGNVRNPGSRAVAEHFLRDIGRGSIITANLATGEEVNVAARRQPRHAPIRGGAQ